MNIKSLITSSADPEKISLTVKSLLTLAVLFGLDSTIVNEAGGYITNLIVGVAMVISAGTGLWGIGRKIKLGKWSASNRYDD